jgi:hypothetical protein
MQEPRVRPTGVTILAILAAIGGVLGLLAGLAVIGLGGFAAGVAGGTAGAALGGLAVFAGLFVLVAAALSLAFAYGAWTLKPWGWILGVASQVLALISVVLSIGSGAEISGQLLNIAIPLLILYYLNTPAVKAAFGRS